MITSLESFKLANGSWDWAAYKAAQKANGETCRDCGGTARILGCGHPVRCHQCESMDEADEVDHDSEVRCPACGHREEVAYMEQYELYEDGGHDVRCGECGCDFEVSTSVSYSFRSPARAKEKEGKTS